MNEDSFENYGSLSIHSNMVKKGSPNIYDDEPNIQKVNTVKMEKDVDDSICKMERITGKINVDSSNKSGDDEEEINVRHQLKQTSNLPSFLHCAMLGKMAETSQNNIQNDSGQDVEKDLTAAISPTQLQKSLYKNIASTASWKQ